MVRRAARVRSERISTGQSLTPMARFSRDPRLGKTSSSPCDSVELPADLGEAEQVLLVLEVGTVREWGAEEGEDGV